MGSVRLASIAEGKLSLPNEERDPVLMLKEYTAGRVGVGTWFYIMLYWGAWGGKGFGLKRLT